MGAALGRWCWWCTAPVVVLGAGLLHQGSSSWGQGERAVRAVCWGLLGHQDGCYMGSVIWCITPGFPNLLRNITKQYNFFQWFGGNQPHSILVVFSWFPGFGQVGLVGPVRKADIWY